jgi:SSS family solute:Na+ symporter
MYIAAATPLVVMALERLVLGHAPAPPQTQPNAFIERTST